MTKPSEYLAVATILALQEMDQSNNGLPAHVDELQILVENIYQISLKSSRIAIILNRLQHLGMLEVVRDSYAGHLIHIKKSLFETSSDKIIQILDPHVIKAVAIGGNSLFQRVFSNPEFWTNLEDEIESSHLDLETQSHLEYKSIIPAADRLVRRDDNQPTLTEIKSKLSELSILIGSQDNEVGDKIGDQRDVIVKEIELAEQVISEPRFRFASLIGWLAPVLRFLADKFAGGAIAEAAKHLLELILTLV